jgi:hypothetical protein
VNVALPRIGADLGAGAAGLQSVAPGILGPAARRTSMAVYPGGLGATTLVHEPRKAGHDMGFKDLGKKSAAPHVDTPAQAEARAQAVADVKAAADAKAAKAAAQRQAKATTEKAAPTSPAGPKKDKPAKT